MAISGINVNRSFSRFAILLLTYSSLSVSCNNVSKADHVNADSLAVKSLSVLEALTAAEMERIKNACQAWYDSALKPKGFNGGVLVAKNGKIVFEQYNGTAHIPGNDSITETTALHIASVTKTFTAMGVLKLWQDGKLNIDDEFGKYFPEFNYPGVTIRSLLNHRSGLPNYTYFMEKLGWDKSRFVTNEDILSYLISRKAELADISLPDTHFSYCNTNYALLALLIEKISGKSYADFISHTFFIPLQMNNSYVFTITDTGKSIPSYNWRGNIEPFNFLDKVYGDKNIYTTVRDLLKWDQALSGTKLFSTETLEQAYAAYSNEKPGVRNYGLGWRMYIYPTGKKVIYHNGWWHGSNASFIRLVNDSATIIAIGNKFTRAVYRVKTLISVFGNYLGTLEEEETEPAQIQNISAQPGLLPGSIQSKKSIRPKK